MAQDLVYPTSVELIEVAQVLMPRLTKDRPAFKLFPIRPKRRHKLIWDQRDNYKGLQQVRGLDGKPSRVNRTGAKSYEMEPGVYGEFIEIPEKEITTRRSYGTFGTPINITDLVMEAQEQLLQRRIDRMETIIWTLLSTGTFSVYQPYTNVLMHTDTFPIKTYTANVPWSTSATAKPLQDFRNAQLFHRGQSVAFNSSSTAYMNQTTFNNLVSNTNQTDLAGRRVTGLLSVLNLGEINKILAGENLPQIEIYDEGYIDDSDTFRLYVPDNTVCLVGQRPAAQTVGEYELTINANNPGAAPGAYTRVIDTGEREVPRRVEVHDGHNGGPAIFFPGAVVQMNV